MLNKQFRGYLGVVVASAFVLSACDQSKTTLGGESAALVNGNKIAAAQVDYELFLASKQQQGLDTAKLAPMALEQLINQELLAQQAIAGNLDDNPAVQVALLRAEKRLLAQAYLEKLYTGLPRPTEDEISTYYNSNPDLFSNRRIYRIQQYVFGAQVSPELIEKTVADSKSPDAFAKTLAKQGVTGNARRVTMPAEKLPLGILPRLSKTKDGQGFAVQGNGRTTVFWRISTELRPVGKEQASPFIVRFLVKQSREKKAREELANLRKMSNLEYKGKYSRGDAAAPEQPLPADISDSEKSDSVGLE